VDAGAQQPVIVAGVSGSRASYAALAWAAAEARRRGARLRVVQAWTARPPRAYYAVAASPGPARPGPARPDPARPDPARPDPARPDPARTDPARTEIELIEGPAERVLVDASAQADLLVLGAGRQPPVGPVIRACLRRARCPVVVVGPDLARSGQTDTPRRTSAAPLAGARAGS
jgi:nucleotide-binding universal stress UspA family protein